MQSTFRILVTAGALFCSSMGHAQTPPAFQRYYDYFISENGRLLCYRPDPSANRYYLLRNDTDSTHLFNPRGETFLPHKVIVPGAHVCILPSPLPLRRIRRGRITDKMIRDYFVPILPPSVLGRIRQRIPDDGRHRDDRIDGKEYGGYYHLFSDQIDTILPGPLQNPCEDSIIAITMDDSAYSFHSHPSAQAVLKPGYVCTFRSPPSLRDQQASHFINYVYGMREHVIYVTCPDGVVAWVRFRIFSKRSLKRTGRGLNYFFIAPPRWSLPLSPRDPDGRQ
ncbi:hypothetical protein [Dinghuibacter silviterrae]|uniref:Uncharacterized protein n=1 Tax=Dinghuibacter silviterrae TaxID=1539049 RepID=A0A4R8DW37_9BACT|nr:hypothetical protein [Dinghuibacter silviterrae]TDX01617.1 hypothetical protein EDB95_2658 [Dinghuibacter silviterrae]